MTTCTWHFLRHPKTTGEKRSNAGFARVDPESGETVKGRLRTGKTGSRLADVRDDVPIASIRDRSRGKPTWSAARKARERARQAGGDARASARRQVERAH